jgi:hypothetical protein
MTVQIDRTQSEAEPVLVEMVRIVGKYHDFTLHELQKLLDAAYLLRAIDHARGINSVFLLPQAFKKVEAVTQDDPYKITK